jgi:hypothetical protein
MIADPVVYLIASVAVGCLGLSKAGFIGFGLIANPLLALAIPPLESAAICCQSCWCRMFSPRGRFDTIGIGKRHMEKNREQPSSAAFHTVG